MWNQVVPLLPSNDKSHTNFLAADVVFYRLAWLIASAREFSCITQSWRNRPHFRPHRCILNFTRRVTRHFPPWHILLIGFPIHTTFITLGRMATPQTLQYILIITHCYDVRPRPDATFGFGTLCHTITEWDCIAPHPDWSHGILINHHTVRERNKKNLYLLSLSSQMQSWYLQFFLGRQMTSLVAWYILSILHPRFSWYSFPHTREYSIKPSL